ncbi:hypothetical protein SNEBB_005468 [Seison nebaliae]|nr:hypothetical protein SNEBB_005468 [Seison nebaliae]
MKYYDLFDEVTRFIDPHMILQILDFMCETDGELETKEEIEFLNRLNHYRLELVSRTCLLSYEKDLREKLNIPMKNEKERISECAAIDAQIESDHNEWSNNIGDYDKDTHKLFQSTDKRNKKHVLIRLAKNFYETGKYQDSRYCFDLMFEGESMDINKQIASLRFGNLAAVILSSDVEFDTVYNYLRMLTDYINDDSPSISHLQRLQWRCWLLHWSLFVFFRFSSEMKSERLLDLFLGNGLITIQTSCQYLLRYLTAAALVSPRRIAHTKELVKILQSERYNYIDPLTDFVQAVHIEYDMEKAKKKLKECEKMLENDFFLNPFMPDIMEAARRFWFDNIIHTYKNVSLETFSDLFEMNLVEVESWVVSVTRNSSNEIKIDHENNQIVITPHYSCPYEKIINLTRSLADRYGGLLSQIISQTNNKH